MASSQSVCPMAFESVICLANELRSKYNVLTWLNGEEKGEQSKTDLIRTLRQLRDMAIAALTAGDAICLVNRHSWRSVRFDPDVGLQLIDRPEMVTLFANRLERVAQLTTLLIGNLTTNEMVSKRDHYYMDGTGSSQDQLDNVIDDIAATFQWTRESLKTISCSEGMIFGDLLFGTDAGEQFSCQNLSLIPTHVPSSGVEITRMSSSAAFVLVVEKDTVFRRLVQQGTHSQLNCIIVTGKGYPDMPTRRFVNQLWDTLRIPILGLFDGDPNGFEIMCIYRFGSLSMAYDCKRLACPQMRWVGFLPSDFNRTNVRGYSTIQRLTRGDVKKLLDLLTRPYVTQMPDLKRELLQMGALGRKRGLEEFSQIRHNFLSSNVLPQLISEGRFI